LSCYILSFFYHLLCHSKNFILVLRIIQITCAFLLFLFLCQGNNTLCTLPTLRGFHAQRFYLNLLPVLGFLHRSTDLDEPDKPVTSVFQISQHMKSYKPSKNGPICASAYLLCAQRFYLSAVFDRTFVHALIALCVADRSGTKVLCANFVANSILQRAQRFY